jgi:hypothetical protein
MDVNVKDAGVGSCSLFYGDIWGTEETHVKLRKDIRPLKKDRTPTTVFGQAEQKR